MRPTGGRHLRGTKVIRRGVLQVEASQAKILDACREEDRGHETPCWVWAGPVNSDGYGIVSVGPRGGRLFTLPHRWAYAVFVGPIPAGLVPDHLCRTPACCNPEHLELVTQRQNVMRGDTIPARNLAKTACPQGHPYDETNTYVTRAGHRQCMTCRKQAQRRRRSNQMRSAA